MSNILVIDDDSSIRETLDFQTNGWKLSSGVDIARELVRDSQ